MPFFAPHVPGETSNRGGKDNQEDRQKDEPKVENRLRWRVQIRKEKPIIKPI